MDRDRYHHGDLRSTLLDGAEALVRERDVESWSLREASARIGVSPSAAYHHFASRDALLSALSQRVMVQLAARLSSAVDGVDGGPRQRLIAYGVSYVRWAFDDPAVARLAFRGGRTVDIVISPHPRDVLVVELDRLVADGGLAASARPGAEFVFWAAVHGLAVLLIDGLLHLEDRQAVDAEAERVAGAVLAGLAQETVPVTPWPTAQTAQTKRLAR